MASQAFTFACLPDDLPHIPFLCPYCEGTGCVNGRFCTPQKHEKMSDCLFCEGMGFRELGGEG